MKKILYIMHVPWGWIKQRPHFIAEGLSNEYNVDVLVRNNSVGYCNNKTSVNIVTIPRLPLERFWYIKKINSIIQSLYLKIFIKKYDIIWLTCPNDVALNAVKYISPEQTLIYDCMDDVVEFSDNEEIRRNAALIEKTIYERANLVLSSSAYLKNKIIGRYGFKDVKIVNNALSSVQLSTEVQSSQLPNKFAFSSKKKIVYIGTVSEWIDIHLVNELSKLSDVEFFFFGPYKDSIKSKFMSKDVHFMGSVEHNLISAIMSLSDVLIMPFIVNELILSVNPVKLYEYISSGKPCFAPKYGESLPFNEYCYLYENEKECVSLISEVIYNGRKSKRSILECIEFAGDNTWENRMVVIKDYINLLINQ